MQAIAVLGISGSGKTTMAGTLARKLGLAHIELDSIFHQPNWTPLESAEFARRVQLAVDEATNGWAMCGGYGSHIDHIRYANADTIVWLDYSKPLVMYRVITRTIRRAITREELWNGNREPLTNFTSWDPEKNVIRWSWVKFADRRNRYEQHLQSGVWDHCTVHRFRKPKDAQGWLDSL